MRANLLSAHYREMELKVPMGQQPLCSLTFSTVLSLQRMVVGAHPESFQETARCSSMNLGGFLVTGEKDTPD